jgi:L-ascorbate metabolism protein UlaG (beta-lactamase superfamily)
MIRFAVVAGLLLLVPHSGFLTPRSEAAQPPDKQPAKHVTLRYYGNSFFQLETSTGKKIVFDPHAIRAFKQSDPVEADVVLISHFHNDHTQVGVLANRPQEVLVGLDMPKKGQTEWKEIDKKIGDVRVRTVGTYHDTEQGMKRGKVAVWVVETDGLVFCHLGDTGHLLSAEQVRQIGPVDVVMVPVGGIYTLNGEQAKKVVDQIKPRWYALPMHYGVKDFEDVLGPEEFLDGQKKVERRTDTNELVLPVGAKPPADGYTVVLLGWEKAPKK